MIANGVCLLLTYALFLFLVTRVWSDAEIAQFDPYAILEIAKDADDKVIRKAYRRLSLQWHPDKNMGNQYAEQMFMMVRKAYEALTDEVAKENWQKYGNPDGKQALEVSIGLPTFLLDKKNHTTILLVYLVFLVVAIPLGASRLEGAAAAAAAGWGLVGWLVGWSAVCGLCGRHSTHSFTPPRLIHPSIHILPQPPPTNFTAVWFWYSESQQYGENNVMHRTYEYYASLLDEVRERVGQMQRGTGGHVYTPRALLGRCWACDWSELIGRSSD